MAYFRLFALQGVLLFSLPVMAHEEIYHIDPPITEHAHMEYEAALGAGFLSGAQVGSQRKDLLRWEVEGNLPVTSDLSLEVVQSFGTLVRGETGLVLGDLEVEPRWVFYDSDRIVWNAGVPFLIPTGDASKGLSEDLYEVEPTIRFDLFLHNVDIYSNSAIGIGLDHSAQTVAQSVAAVYLWRVTDDVTLSPFAELSGTVSNHEGDRILGALGFGGALREWFALIEFQQPILYEEGPNWAVVFHVGYHKVKRH